MCTGYRCLYECSVCHILIFLKNRQSYSNFCHSVYYQFNESKSEWGWSNAWPSSVVVCIKSLSIYSILFIILLYYMLASFCLFHCWVSLVISLTVLEWKFTISTLQAIMSGLKCFTFSLFCIDVSGMTFLWKSNWGLMSWTRYHDVIYQEWCFLK